MLSDYEYILRVFMGMCDCDSLENVICHAKEVICSSLFEYMSTVVKTPTFCICENKVADQHRSICEADQRVCFRLYKVCINHDLGITLTYFMARPA